MVESLKSSILPKQLNEKSYSLIAFAWNLHVFFFSFSFSCQPYPELWNCKSVFLILKISQYGVSRRCVQLFPRYPRMNWYKNWYLHFYKTYDHQIWREGTSAGFHSNETNQACAGKVITSRSLDKLKTFASGHQTWLDGNLPRCAPDHKVTQPFVRLRDKRKSLYLHYHSAYGHETWQDGNLLWWAPAHKVVWDFDHVVL